MDNSRIIEALRLALSHREKAESLRSECAKAFAAGEIDRERHDSLMRFYHERLSLADHEIGQLRAETQARLDEARRELRRLQRGLGNLAKDTTTGRLPAGQAARRTTRISREIAGVEGDIALYERLLEVDKSAGVGGFIDRAIERYVPEAPPNPSKRGRWPRWAVLAVEFVAACAVVGIACALTLPRLEGFEFVRWFPNRPALECAAGLLDAERGLVELRCRNVGGAPLSLYVPWPPGMPESLNRRERAAAFGLQVQVRETGQTGFRRYPGAALRWTHRDMPFESGQSVVIEPAASAIFVLDMFSIQEGGVAAEAVLMTMTRGDGARVREYELELPATPPAPAPARPSLPPPPPEAPEEAPTPPAAPDAAEPPSDQPEPQPESEQERDPVMRLQFIGGIGGRILVGVTGPDDERERRLSLQVGDEVAFGWQIEEVGQAPSELVLKHVRTGETARIPRGPQGRELRAVR